MAKEIIKVSLRAKKIEADKCRTDLLVLGLFSDVKKLDKICSRIDLLLKGAIKRVQKLGDFKGRQGSSTVLYGNETIGAQRVLLVGLGAKKEATLDTVRKSAAHSAKCAVAMKVKNMAVALHSALEGRLDLEKMGQVIAEGIYFGSYRYDEFVTGSENGRLDSLNVELIDSDTTKKTKLNKGLSRGTVIGQAQSYARTLANRPGNVINPARLAAEAKKIASNTAGLTCTVLDDRQLKVKGMGGILAVGSGSVNKPKLIILKYKPAGTKGAKQSRIALVGKAITFDSGGISIKPAANMDQMKLDKSGGVAILGTMKAVAELKLPVTVYGIIPAAENLPSGTSYRPGDIIKTFSGKTVEVQNTDAEGRMILCDAISYAVGQKCETIIDIATLTGACMVALGKYMAGLMGNDDKLIEQIKTAATAGGEKVWHMPSGKEYLEEMKSKIADLKNIGSRWGGACTAAAFLGEFAGKSKWAHLDMAGVDILEKDSQFTTQGSPGFGVRLLTTYLINMVKRK